MQKKIQENIDASFLALEDNLFGQTMLTLVLLFFFFFSQKESIKGIKEKKLFLVSFCLNLAGMHFKEFCSYED